MASHLYNILEPLTVPQDTLLSFFPEEEILSPSFNLTSQQKMDKPLPPPISEISQDGG